MAKPYIYFFSDIEKVEELTGGDSEALTSLLGGKGANLAIIARLGIPVPGGFTITTEACNDYYKQSPPGFPPHLWESLVEAIKRLEHDTGKGFGVAAKPLLLACRSGAKISMPGMMDTVLNIGLNDETVPGMIALTQNPRFVYDSYRRLLQGYGAIVMNVKDDTFEDALHAYKESKKYDNDDKCTAEDWQYISELFKKLILEKTGQPFPQDPYEQIKNATMAVFRSWNSERAIDYRNHIKIRHDLGTAVTIMSMVFGNMGDTSATGVAFTRDPSTGERVLWGDFLVNAQGEDVVAGVRNADHISTMKEKLPEAYQQFVDITQKLEKHYREMQDVEFTVEERKLWMLQTRTGKRTAAAAVKIALDMVEEGLITKEEALMRVTGDQINQLLLPSFSEKDIKTAAPNKLTKGVNASPGAGVGQIYFTAEKCKEMAQLGQKVIMIRPFTKPDDLGGMLVAKAIVTAEGGAASHAAVIARQIGIPAAVGCSQMKIDQENRTITVNGVVVKEGELLSCNGSTGEIFKGEIPLTNPKIEDQTDLLRLLVWADEVRSMENGRPSIFNGPTRGLMVWANADTPEDARRARAFGAEGIGLIRTEHMFLGDRSKCVTDMILAENDTKRDECLRILGEIQTDDFEKIFESMTDLPTVIRLIDPPLHEFLPCFDVIHEEVLVLKTRKECGVAIDENLLLEKQKLLNKARELRESNPMIGTRGVRLCLVIPGLVRMQIKAIVEGACLARKKGFNPIPEVMIPLTMHVSELIRIKPIYDEVLAEVLGKYGMQDLHIKFGTMIEVPRACLTSDEIARVAEFYSFGTNDLHQMAMGMSRDDSEGGFLQHYYEWGLFQDSPFQTIDQVGVGKLMRTAVKDGRKVRPDISVGICGEHGGDPRSIDFCHRLGMNYVSCSPFRIPVARLAAAQAVLRNKH
jgi:pyruvate,orthophosphate dikinase